MKRQKYFHWIINLIWISVPVSDSEVWAWGSLPRNCWIQYITHTTTLTVTTSFYCTAMRCDIEDNDCAHARTPICTHTYICACRISPLNAEAPPHLKTETPHSPAVDKERFKMPTLLVYTEPNEAGVELEGLMLEHNCVNICPAIPALSST